jgi:hypothetical protein
MEYTMSGLPGRRFVASKTHYSGFLLTKLIPDGFNRLMDERPHPLHLSAFERLGLGRHPKKYEPFSR